MGEIDTKPIEPVQVALTLFEEKRDHRRHRSSSNISSSEEMEKEKKDVEGLLKDLANCKVQLEAKDHSYSQLLLQLENYQKTTEDLSTRLQKTEIERDIYREECREADVRIIELESKVKEMADQLLETGKLREQLSHVLSELKYAQGELISMETELAGTREANYKAMAHAEQMENEAKVEKERSEELLKHVAELNDAIHSSNIAVAEAEEEKFAVLTEKRTEIENMRKQLDMMKELENRLVAKSPFIDSLQAELNQSNELFTSSDKVVSEAINDLNQLKADLKGKERENSDQAFYIGALETEMNQLKLELKNAKDEVTRLNNEVEMLTDELLKVKTEMDEIKEIENEAQVEIAMLKAELHKGRSKLAAAEAAEARAGGLCIAVQRLAVEAEEAKKENQRLKQGSGDGDGDYEEPNDDQFGLVGSSQAAEISQENDSNNNITVSLAEYQSLIQKAEKANQDQVKNFYQLVKYEDKNDMEMMKKELEVAMAKVGEFRNRAEQAYTRAEAAEKAKMALEDQLRRWRQHKQKRKAALAALREESWSREFSVASISDCTPKKSEPLGKILNMML